MAHVRQSRPDSGLGLHAKALKISDVVPSSGGQEAAALPEGGRPHGQGANKASLLPRLELSDINSLRTKNLVNRQSRPDSSLGFRLKALRIFPVLNPLQGYLTYKKTHPLGPHRRPTPRVLGGS